MNRFIIVGVGMFNKLKVKIFGKVPEGYCKICRRQIYDLDTVYGIRTLCVYCYEAYEEGATNPEIPDGNNFGCKWYTQEEIKNVLSIDMMKMGYRSVWDPILQRYRITKW